MVNKFGFIEITLNLAFCNFSVNDERPKEDGKCLFTEIEMDNWNDVRGDVL